MDNLPPELQWCIKNQLQQSSLLALEELTSLLCEYSQIILTAQKNLQQSFSSTQTKPTTHEISTTRLARHYLRKSLNR